MKTVLLFRHGKSDWNAPYSHDHERPLAARGRKASEAMGRWLATQGPLPDQIICSTAKRARQTCLRAAKAGGWDAPITYDRSLYGAMPETLLNHIRAQPHDAACVMLVGHQPTWSATAALLSNAPTGHFPTATMACIVIPAASWVEVAFGSGRLAWLQRPKEL